jgi:predicted nucleotidyltransferase
MGAAVPERIEQAAADLAGRLRARFGVRVREVRLFGSHARGEGNAASDVDVFVLVADLAERERAEVFELAGEVSLQHLVTVQAFAPTPSEHAWLARYECRILRDIAAEGVSL